MKRMNYKIKLNIILMIKLDFPLSVNCETVLFNATLTSCRTFKYSRERFRFSLSTKFLLLFSCNFSNVSFRI